MLTENINFETFCTRCWIYWCCELEMQFLCATLNRYFCAFRPQRLSPPPATHYHFNHCLCLFSYCSHSACQLYYMVQRYQSHRNLCLQITMLHNLINRAVYKFLKFLIKTLFVISESVLDCMTQTCCVKERRGRFLRRTGLLRHAVLHSLTAPCSFCSSIFLQLCS